MKKDEELLRGLAKERHWDKSTVTDEFTEEMVKPAMEKQAIPFTEWCAINYCPVVKNGIVVHWTKGTYQNLSKLYSTSELYAIYNNNEEIKP
jgi:hypothetical protein